MQKTKLYNDKATLFFDEANHIYSLDEKQEKIIPGVTSITSMVAKPALVQWAVNCAYDKMREVLEKNLDPIPSEQDIKYEHRRASSQSAVLGTMVHKFIEMEIKGLEPDWFGLTTINPMGLFYKEFISAYASFKKWRQDTKPEFIMSERPILSQKYGYAGTLDFTANIDIAAQGKKFDVESKKHILGDFKTSKAIYPEYFMETAARVKALEEEFPDVKYDAMMIVRVGKDGKYETKVETDIDKYFKAFLGAKQLYMTFKA